MNHVNNLLETKFIFLILILLLQITDAKSKDPNIKLKVEMIGDLMKDSTCKIVVKNIKNSKESKFIVKDCIICSQPTLDTIPISPNCYVLNGNIISKELWRKIIITLPNGDFKLTIENIICGPPNEDNSDINHFSLNSIQINMIKK